MHDAQEPRQGVLHFQVLSALLTYPGPELLAALPELQAALAAQPALADKLTPLFDFLASQGQVALQENYVATFDRNPKHSLHLFEHIHGESRDRGQAMVDLLQEYKRHGLLMTPDELPDYVPLFLEFLSQLPAEDAERLLGDAIHVLALIGDKLQANGSPYHCVFGALRMLTTVEPKPLVEPPVRDMDEAMEVFGPSPDGVEPLLKPGVQSVKFYPKGHRVGAVSG
ncbi:nitrate reductase delta subunit [Chitinivorax tropicus]|uniref:Nitrate reductase delta subunit n=1 Tax=Chitinivorax tropicus TaxID=714531 RepID=A0A840MS42_9PROT|nr:nitrate reductase molybdenum cofactor assembly chaperone [Chitinivorax tropicus]MBB5019592.1 nitrate reductase delta subunit [Chitinivorax tropicus]